jgi:hypothetical protein
VPIPLALNLVANENLYAAVRCMARQSLRLLMFRIFVFSCVSLLTSTLATCD